MKRKSLFPCVSMSVDMQTYTNTANILVCVFMPRPAPSSNTMLIIPSSILHMSTLTACKLYWRNIRMTDKELSQDSPPIRSRQLNCRNLFEHSESCAGVSFAYEFVISYWWYKIYTTIHHSFISFIQMFGSSGCTPDHPIYLVALFWEVANNYDIHDPLTYASEAQTAKKTAMIKAHF